MYYKKILSGILFSLSLAGCVTMSDLPMVGAYDKSTDEGKFVELYDFTGLSLRI